jgi:hypothetical protein
MAKTYRRRKKLINPRFQLKLACAGLAISLVSVMVLMILLNEAIMEMMDSGWVDPLAVQSGWIGMLAGKLVIAAALLIPLTIALGIILTHRIAGPMYRFEKWLMSVHQGEKPGPCVIRKGDEFQEFCDLLNKVTAPLREEKPAEPTEEAAPGATPVRRTERIAS